MKMSTPITNKQYVVLEWTHRKVKVKTWFTEDLKCNDDSVFEVIVDYRMWCVYVCACVCVSVGYVKVDVSVSDVREREKVSL